MRAFGGILRRWGAIAIALNVMVAIALGVLIQLKVHDDQDAAMRDYQSRSMERTRDVLHEVDQKFAQIHSGLRTVSLLPSVRRISRYAENLDKDDLSAIQDIYRELFTRLNVSEIYIVQADFNPERMDPATGALQTPILMMDDAVVGTEAQLADASAGSQHVEIYEYRALKEQLDWLKQRHPVLTESLRERLPLLASDEVITCDNRVYEKTLKDADRAGMVISLPFYGPDGKLKGTISAIIRTGVIASYLPYKDYALLSPIKGFSIIANGGGQASASVEAINWRRPDSSLLYSEVADLTAYFPQGRWRLWAGKPDAEFWNSEAVRSIITFRNYAYGLLALLSLALSAGVVFLRRIQIQDERQRSLEALAHREETEKLEAQNASSAKSQFLATMSHELRTPLNAIINYAEMIAEDAEDTGQEATQKDAVKISRAGKHLLELINDILDFSKIEAGRIDVEPDEFDVASLMEDIASLMQGAADANDVILSVDLAADLGAGHTDALKLKQCLLNLLSNAVKFSNNGSVSFTARRVQCVSGAQGLLARPAFEMGHDMLEFVVSDTGIGMSPEQIAGLFQPFKQADASITRKFGGTGLGLSITRGIAEALGGDVSVTSELGRGSTFTLRVSAVLDAAKKPDSGSKENPASRHKAAA